MFSAIANTFANCFKIPELKSRIIFTLLLLGVCRLIAMIPLPGLDGAALAQYFDELARQQQQGGGVVGLYNSFTGGALTRCAVGSLGIMPYISASIIIQLLGAVVPQLSKLAREEGGRAKLIQYGRYLTIVLCLGQGFVLALGLENAANIFQGFEGQLVLYKLDGWQIWWYRIQTTLLVTAGTALLMWLGEQITERGIGNGVSLVITIGILADLPMTAQGLMDMFNPDQGDRQYGLLHGIGLLLMFGAVIVGIVAVTQTQRKIPVQYAQRTVGRKVLSGGSSFMPLRLNYTGVMPVIFAQALLMFPEKIFFFLGKLLKGDGATQSGFAVGMGTLFDKLAILFQAQSFFYITVYSLMILFFSYFWVATQFNETQISDDLKKNGGYIPGIRPGKETTDFLHRTMSRITLAGAVFLVIISVIPILMGNAWQINPYVAQFFGGTSLLITVGVMLDTMRQMESHLMMRHYDGFLKKGKIKGRF
jgi:preprotein translocase subunit SecY